MSRHDVAIYAPWSGLVYERRRGAAPAAANADDAARHPALRTSSLALYAFGVPSSTVVFVQSRQRVDLAHRVFPGVKRLVQIPSFAEINAGATSLPTDEGEACLWSGRVVEYKQPLKYVELPCGDHDERVIAAAGRAGYDTAGTLPGFLHRPQPMMHWPRLSVNRDDTMRRFRAKLRRVRASWA